MRSAFVVARQELVSARRERLTSALLFVFLGMAIASGGIGWAARHTVTNVWTLTVAQTGRNVPNPFLQVPALDPIKNTIVYVVLIGALLAIVVGVRSSIRDRKSGVTDLILSRPISTRAYVAGKLMGTQAWMGIVLLAAMAASWVGVWVVSGNLLSLGETGSLFAFFALAWLFLLPFNALGITIGARSRHESTALLVPVLIWAAATFVIPQLGTAQNPSSLLNPVPTAPSTTDLFFRINQAVLRPISFTEHFRHASASILHLRGADPSIGGDLLSVALMAGLSLALLAMVSRSSMRRPLYE
jgi:ABC-2 type transport system permease protein